jgi:hypothetical protein
MGTHRFGIATGGLCAFFVRDEGGLTAHGDDCVTKKLMNCHMKDKKMSPDPGRCPLVFHPSPESVHEAFHSTHFSDFLPVHVDYPGGLCGGNRCAGGGGQPGGSGASTAGD